MTYRLHIEYDGTDFCGWQRQAGQPTVQQALEEALGVVLPDQPPVTGSGRTDSGVHARGQVAHFSTTQPVNAHHLRRVLNGILPSSIVILDLTETAEEFHARYDTRRRRYHYYIYL